MRPHLDTWRSLVGCALICVAALGCSQAAGESDFQAVRMLLPVGDADAGRTAFLDLSCNSCHVVAGESDFPEPTSAQPGPRLSLLQAGQTPDALATSIVAPAHEIAEAVRARYQGQTSPMGDYTEVMSVRQLADLVAYIRSLDDLR